MADSDSSSLSSAPPTDDEAMEAHLNATATKATGLNRYFKPAPKKTTVKEDSPEPPKRAPSPPHEYVLADKDAIAFLIMFRSRFSEAFPKSLPHYGPQDIERGIVGDIPDEQVERLLCALLGLVLNRKKDVERGHYGRALEDAIQQNQSQWPSAWNETNPLHGGKTFNSMTADERLVLLKTLVLWSLSTSEAISTSIKSAYKQTRRDDDKNQPKAVQPWFSDSWRRKYYLIEGQEDTHFRIYRENDGKTLKTNTWFSVAGNIEDAKALADKFEQESFGQQGKLNAEKIRGAVPRWEAGEEKRRRRDYRVARKAAFTRPDSGFSLYEGRTRGKRMRYTYSDGEEEDSDALSTRRSTRNASGFSTPLEEARTTVTSSGRQVKSRLGGSMYGESMLTDRRKEMERNHEEADELAEEDIGGSGGGRVQSSNVRGRYAEGLDSESESEAAEPSGDEWSGNEEEADEDEEREFDEADVEESEDELMQDAEGEENSDENTQESLVVQLRYRKGGKPNGMNGNVSSRDRSPHVNDQNLEQQQTQHENSPLKNDMKTSVQNLNKSKLLIESQSSNPSLANGNGKPALMNGTNHESTAKPLPQVPHQVEKMEIS